MARSGTAAKAQATLKRADLYGKTGTTNDSIDAWFAGFQPTLAAVVWMGYDTPRKLGDRETGGGLSLPVWISFMETALKGVPVIEPHAARRRGQRRRRVVLRGIRARRRRRQPGPATAGAAPDRQRPTRSRGSAACRPARPPTAADERNRILDLFRN